jgi:hypothetical protein
LSWINRGLLWLAALLLLLPSTSNLLLFADFAGFALGAAIFAWEWYRRDHISKMVTESSAINP